MNNSNYKWIRPKAKNMLIKGLFLSILNLSSRITFIYKLCHSFILSTMNAVYVTLQFFSAFKRFFTLITWMIYFLSMNFCFVTFQTRLMYILKFTLITLNTSHLVTWMLSFSIVLISDSSATHKLYFNYR